MNEEGFLLDQVKNIPLPKHLGFPRREKLAMDPIELELILFLNENFLPPSFFDDIMNWAFKAHDVGYLQKRDHAPSHQTLKIQFSAEKDDCGIWYISGRNNQSIRWDSLLPPLPPRQRPRESSG